jgi:hypothetical protein
VLVPECEVFVHVRVLGFNTSTDARAVPTKGAGLVRVPCKSITGVLILGLAVTACSSGSNTSSGSTPSPGSTTEVSASDLALIHTVTGLGGLKSSRLRDLGLIATVYPGGVAEIEVISVDGANTPALDTNRLTSDATVAELYAVSGRPFDIQMTAPSMNGLTFDYTAGHQGGKHFVLLTTDSQLFNVVHGSSDYVPGSLANYGETLQEHAGNLTISLLRVLPDTGASLARMVNLAATETCNALLHVSVLPETIQQVGAKYVTQLRDEGQEVICNSIGEGAESAVVGHLTYQKYLVSIAGDYYPALDGEPAPLGVDPQVYTLFKLRPLTAASLA